MGHITAIEGDKLTIKPVKGSIIVISKERVIDKGLMKEINLMATQKEKDLNMPILWSELDGDIICVIGLLTPEQVNSRINTFRDGENLRAALSLAILLNNYSQHPIYVKQLSKMQDLCHVNSKSPSKSFFESGMEMFHDGRYGDSIGFFKRALEKKEKIQESLKGLVNAYTANDQLSEAIKVVEGYGLKEFRDPFKFNAKNYGWLRNWLFNQGMWTGCIQLVQKKLNCSPDADNKQKSSLYSYIASCYLKMENDNEATKVAEDYFRQALELDPTNRDAKTSLQEITGEFMGTSASVDSLENSLFTTTLLSIQNKHIYLEAQPSQQLAEKLETEYRQLNYKSYDEKAKVLLQRAKVESKLNPAKNEQLNILLSLYLTSYAQGGYKKGLLEKDSLRFLLCESISVRGDRLPRNSVSKVLDSMSIFFNTFNPNKELVFKSMQKMVDILDSRDLYTNSTFYDQVSSLMQYRYPFNRLTSYFYNSQYQVSANEYLVAKGYKLPEGFTEEEFVSAWNELIIAKRKMIKQLQQQFTKAASCNEFDELYNRIKELYEKRQTYSEVLSELDFQRFDEMLELLSGILHDYFHSDDPITKQMRYKDSLDGITKMTGNYTLAPTRFSFDSLTTLLNKCSKMIEEDFQSLISTSKPRLNIDIIGDCSTDEDQDEVVFQIVITNQPGCMPANNFSLKIHTSDEIIEHLKGFSTNYNPINGGSSQIVQQAIKVAPGVIEKGALGLEAELTYKYVDIEDMTPSVKLSLQFEGEAERIRPNPYAYFTGSPLSQENAAMFKGRSEYIKRTADSIMNTDLPKQIIIYGQRRSGKTSVLNFLKAELQKRGAFCIEFSLESLGKDIRVTGASDIFYAFIMARIAEAVQNIDESERPDFKYAKGEYYKNEEKIYPEYCQSFEVANKFTKDIVELQKAFDAIPRWKGHKIVLMMDEFTSVYSLIKSGHLPDTVMKQWKAVTQDERVHFSAVMIGQDTTPQFMKEPYAENAFGVIDKDRLDYLPEEGARELIVNPLRDKEGKSRFLNKAVERIMDLTACNPYFLMNFCARLVDYMNDKKKGKVTEVDVDNALHYYFNHPNKPLKDDMFHSLYSAVDVEEEEKQKVKSVLNIIARGMESKEMTSLTPEWIIKQSSPMGPDEVREILNDLDRREVAPLKEGKHRIKVLMFQKWLLNS